MTKSEFLKRLGSKLSALPDEDKAERLAFYSEMIDDLVEDGYSEEDAVATLGDVLDIKEQIIENTPITRLVKKKLTSRRRMGAFEITLLILGSPIWLSILIALATVVFSVYVSLWSVIISLWAVQVSLAVCGIVGIITGAVYTFSVGTIPGIVLIGASLVCAG
ncbi:MAG: DUF1700 domain-containing protein, partial [Clostridia bacterium]|nr:DUF1700 domain-containing protein [Clostridia bacterium]